MEPKQESPPEAAQAHYHCNKGKRKNYISLCQQVGTKRSTRSKLSLTQGQSSNAEGQKQRGFKASAASRSLLTRVDQMLQTQLSLTILFIHLSSVPHSRLLPCKQLARCMWSSFCPKQHKWQSKQWSNNCRYNVACGAGQ